MANESSLNGDPAIETAWVQVVQEQVKAIRFGVVQVTIHDGRVVQVERTDRVRVDPNASRFGRIERRTLLPGGPAGS